MIRDTLLESKAALESSSLFLKWKKDNPKESARVEGYWANGGVFPLTATAFGLHYALDARAFHETTPLVVSPPSASAAANPPRPEGADISLFPLPAGASGSAGSSVFTPDLSLPFAPI